MLHFNLLGCAVKTISIIAALTSLKILLVVLYSSMLLLFWGTMGVALLVCSVVLLKVSKPFI